MSLYINQVKARKEKLYTLGFLIFESKLLSRCPLIFFRNINKKYYYFIFIIIKIISTNFGHDKF
jgi:hypothetical protein